MPVFVSVYEPPVNSTTYELQYVKEVPNIPSNVSYNSATGMYYTVVNGVRGYYYFHFDPEADVVYFATPAGSDWWSQLQRRIVDGFVSSYIYKSFHFLRNDVPAFADTTDLQSRIVNQLKLWLLIAVGIGVAFLVIRFGFPYLIRFLFPLAIIGAISRIGRKDDS